MDERPEEYNKESASLHMTFFGFHPNGIPETPLIVLAGDEAVVARRAGVGHDAGEKNVEISM